MDRRRAEVAGITKSTLEDVLQRLLRQRLIANTPGFRTPPEDGPQYSFLGRHRHEITTD